MWTVEVWVSLDGIGRLYTERRKGEDMSRPEPALMGLLREPGVNGGDRGDGGN